MEKQALSTYKTICPICKESVKQTGKGRPKVYHEKCRKFDQLAGWIEDIISELPPAAAKVARSRLWYIGNLVNARQVVPIANEGKPSATLPGVQ